MAQQITGYRARTSHETTADAIRARRYRMLTDSLYVRLWPEAGRQNGPYVRYRPYVQ